MGERHYPPASLVHSPGCPALPKVDLQQLATRAIATAYPNAVMHNCYHFHRNSHGIVEPRTYPPHDYKPSTVAPADAVRPLCDTCRGTHEGEHVSGILTATPRLVPPPPATQSLLLPGRPASQIILPGNL